MVFATSTDGKHPPEAVLDGSVACCRTPPQRAATATRQRAPSPVLFLTTGTVRWWRGAPTFTQQSDDFLGYHRALPTGDYHHLRFGRGDRVDHDPEL